MMNIFFRQRENMLFDLISVWVYQNLDIALGIKLQQNFSVSILIGVKLFDTLNWFLEDQLRVKFWMNVKSKSQLLWWVSLWKLDSLSFSDTIVIINPPLLVTSLRFNYFLASVCFLTVSGSDILETLHFPFKCAGNLNKWAYIQPGGYLGSHTKCLQTSGFQIVVYTDLKLI